MESTEKTITDYLKLVSPGMPLRNVIDDLIKSDLGALIVFYNEEIDKIMDGGFKTNCLFTQQRLFELSKMDGAIIVSPDLRRILYANVLLAPESKISTAETGTRHKAAERTAKQANTFVIAVSERKKKTTIYCSSSKYILKSTEQLLGELTSNLQALEKQRELFDDLIKRLNILEISALVTTSDICKILQRTQMILRISENIKKYFTELGREGNIMNMRYKELIKGIEKVENEVIRDYGSIKLKRARVILENLSLEGLLDLEAIARLVLERTLDENLAPKGYRLLPRINLSENEIAKLAESFKNINELIEADTEQIEFVLKNRGETIKQDLSRLREQLLSGN